MTDTIHAKKTLSNIAEVEDLDLIDYELAAKAVDKPFCISAFITTERSQMNNTPTNELRTPPLTNMFLFSRPPEGCIKVTIRFSIGLIVRRTRAYLLVIAKCKQCVCMHLGGQSMKGQIYAVNSTERTLTPITLNGPFRPVPFSHQNGTRECCCSRPVLQMSRVVVEGDG